MRKPIPPYLIFLVFFFLMSSYARAQYFKPVWVNDIGGTGDSKAANIATDNNGNIYISGYIRGTVTFNLKEGGTKTLTSNGDADVYVAKYSITTGNYIWAFSIGGPNLEQTNSMAIDNAGNVLITGQFQSTVNFNPSGNFSLSPNGADDTFVAKYGSDGSFLWAISMGGGSTDRGHYITTDNQNNVFITASYTGAIDVDPSVAGTYLLPDQGGLALFFAKYDANGNFIWAHPLGLVNQQNLSAIAIDKTTNDVIVTGDFFGNVDFSYTGQPGAAFNSPVVSNFIARYDNNGVYKWVKYLPGSGSGILSSLKIDNQSNIIITGNFGGQFYPSGLAGSPISSYGPSDVLLASYKADGTLNWAENFGSSSSNASSRYVCLDANNNIFITGYFTGTVSIDPTLSDGVLTDNAGGRAGLIAGFSSTGKPLAAGAFSSGCSSNLGYEVAAVNGHIYVCGGFCQTVDFDTGSCETDNFTSINSTADSFLASFTIANNLPGTITGFTVPQQVSPTVIDQLNHTITVTVAWNTDVTSLTPTITTNAGTLSPASGVAENFTSPVVYTLTSGCMSTPYTVTVVLGPQPKAVTICAGTLNSITGDALSATPDSYTWQVFLNNSWVNAPGTINAKDYQTSALTNNTSANIIYSLRREVKTQGVISDDSYYDVTVQPSAPINSNTLTSPVPSSFCATSGSGNALVINGSAPTGGNGTYTYQWQSSADNFTFNDLTGATSKDYTIASVNTTTYYRRIVASGTCVASSTSNVITITVLPIVSNNTIEPPAVTAFCTTGDPSVITGSTPTGGDNTYNYQWQSSTDNNMFTDIAGATDKDFDPGVLNTTTYYRRTVTSGACSTPQISNVVSIVVASTPEAPVVTVASTTTSSITFQWNAVPGATGYLVSTDNGQTFTDPSSGSNGLTHTVDGLQAQQSITIIVTALGASPCQSSTLSTAVTGTTLTPLGDQIFVPNAFTPNGDGRNDIVYVRSANIKSLKFYVYDQWGELLYTSVDQNSGWDGTYKGTKEPAGVYVYYLEAIMNDGQQVNKKGMITLLR